MAEKKSNKGIFKSFQPVDMENLMGNDFGANDLLEGFGLSGAISNKKFLKRFSADDMMGIMQKVGLVDHFSSIGLKDIVVKVNLDESQISYFKIYWKDEGPDNLLVDLRVSESKFMPKSQFFDDSTDIVTYDMIVIEWLSAQNPKNFFMTEKPQLPGQKKPGLGVLKFCFCMMDYFAKEIIKDGFLDIPDHMHGAIMYSKEFKFFDPAHEAILRAILRDLKHYSLSDISWGMITGTIRETTKNIVQVYDPSEQIFYVSRRLRKYFHSKKYKSVFSHYYHKKKYELDYDEMIKKREVILKKKAIVDL
jgi:hypothetical protein